MPQIYISKAGENLGPFAVEDVHALVGNGHFAWEDLAWTEGFEDWAPLRQVVEHAAADDSAVMVEEEEEEERGFFASLLLAFVYPFRGSSAFFILLFGTILMIMLGIMKYAFIFGVFGTLFLTGYYIAFLFKIVQETAAGEQDVAEFPALQDVSDDVLRPLVQFFFAILICLLPAIGTAVYFGENLEEWGWVPFLCLLGGLFYLPMVLLATVIFNSVLTALNPLLVIPAISRIFLRYLVIVFLLAGTVIGREMLVHALNERVTMLVALLLVSFVSFYMGIIQARILGLIYRTSRDQIGWFNR